MGDGLYQWWDGTIRAPYSFRENLEAAIRYFETLDIGVPLPDVAWGVEHFRDGPRGRPLPCEGRRRRRPVA